MKDNHKVFWAPNANWYMEGNSIVINEYKFNMEITDLFPKFYFMCVKGTDIESLRAVFDSIPLRFLKRLVKDLTDLGILITSPQSIPELFYGQSKIFLLGEKPDLDFFMNKEKVEQYRVEKSYRTYEGRAEKEVPLKSMPIGEHWKNRYSVRNFDTSRAIDYDTFCAYLSILFVQSEKSENKIEPAKYNYPSAGGLYPLDFYLYVKENRVEGVEPGLYYLDPVQKRLVLIKSDPQIDRSAHFAVNKDIFTDSAFSIFVFYNANVSMPKYQDLSYFYGILDTGFAASALEMHAFELGLGSCSLGDIRFSKIEKNFHLNLSQKHIHTLEIGLLK